MNSLRERLEAALAATSTESDLAKALVDSGSLDEAIRLGTYDEQEVIQRLSYASDAALRAAVSKARRSKGTFPLPKVEGRRWSRTDVEKYRKTQRTSASK